MLHTRVPAVLLVISMNGVNNAVALILHWYPSSQTSARLPPLRVQASTRDALAWMNRLPKKLGLSVLVVGRGQIQVSRSHRTRIFFPVSCINHLNVQHECQLTSGSPDKLKHAKLLGIVRSIRTVHRTSPANWLVCIHRVGSRIHTPR